MDEQSKPPRRPRIAGDIERGSYSRRRTPVEGVPIVVERESSEAILISKQLDVLHERFEGMSKSVSAWSAESVRHSEKIQALSTSIGSVIAYTEPLGRSQARTEEKLTRTEALLVDIAATLKDLVTRVGRLEEDGRRLREDHSEVDERLEANERRSAAIEQRLTALEQRGTEQLVRRDERKKVLTWGKAALFGAGGALMAIAEQLGLFG